MVSVLRNRALLAVSLGHLAVDTFSSALPVLLVVFAARLDLSNVAIGTVVTVYALGTSLTQPFFGLVADRWDTRWLGVGSLLWQAAGFVLATLLPGYAAFVAFALAALGPAAYHPVGSLNIRRTAGARAATGTSVFFFFGMAGHGLGPMLAGFVLARASLLQTTIALAGVALPAALLLAVYAPRGEGSAGHVSHPGAEETHRMEWAPLRLLAFLFVFFFFAWPLAATTTFLPKWLSDAGFSSSAFGGLLGTFALASAFGTIAGGALADRWSRKGVVVLALAVAPLPFYLLYATPSVGPGTVWATALAGFALGMPQSVLIVMGQNLFPRRMGFGSGMVLGFFFTVNALAGWLNGWLADYIGLHQTLQLAPWMCLVAAGCALLLPRTRRGPAVAPTAAATGGLSGGQA